MSNTVYEKAIEVAGTYDVATPRDSVVLYSISYLPTTENRDQAFAYVKAHPETKMIEDTVCGRTLMDMGVGYHEVGLSQDEIAQIWAIASRRFISNVKGQVVAFVKNAHPKSIFRMIELPLLLTNENVTTINGIDKYKFAKSFDKKKALD